MKRLEKCQIAEQIGIRSVVVGLDVARLKPNFMLWRPRNSSHDPARCADNSRRPGLRKLPWVMVVRRESRESDVQDAGNVGQIRRETAQSELLDELRAIDRWEDRQIVGRQSVASFVDESRREHVRIGNRRGVILARGVARCDRREQCS